MSARQQQTSAHSLNHLVGASKQCSWHNDAKRLRRLQINHQFELGRLLDRKVGRPGPLENLVNEDGGSTTKIWNIGPVSQEETGRRQLSPETAGRWFLK